MRALKIRHSIPRYTFTTTTPVESDSADHFMRFANGFSRLPWIWFDNAVAMKAVHPAWDLQQEQRKSPASCWSLSGMPDFAKALQWLRPEKPQRLLFQSESPATSLSRQLEFLKARYPASMRELPSGS